MGFIYLVLFVGIAAVCFYVTGKALGEMDGVRGFNLLRFIIQAVLAGVPGMLWLTTIGSLSRLSAGVIIFFIAAAIIHILYCIKLFGTGQGIAVAVCSMVSAFIIVILMIFAMENLKKLFRSFAGKGKK